MTTKPTADSAPPPTPSSIRSSTPSPAQPVAGGPTAGPRLGPLTWPEAGPRPDRSGLLVVPLGSTEQHGPHLPLETDTLIAEAWAVGVADRIPGAVVAPPLPYGSAGEHQAFAGTLSIGGPALHQVIVELARSAAATFPRLALLSGHAGNLGPLRRATDQLRHEGHDVTLVLASWPTTASTPIDAHAGRTETSLLLHLRPDLVRLEWARPGATEPVDELMDRLVAGGVAAVSPNGVLGDPEGASAAEGQRLLDDLIDRTVARLAGTADGAIDPEAEPEWADPGP